MAFIFDANRGAVSGRRRSPGKAVARRLLPGPDLGVRSKVKRSGRSSLLNEIEFNLTLYGFLWISSFGAYMGSRAKSRKSQQKMKPIWQYYLNGN